MGLTRSESQTISNIRRGISAITLITSLFVIGSSVFSYFPDCCPGAILLFQKYKFPHSRLILHLSIAVFLQTFAYLQPYPGGDVGICDLQAWWISFFDWAIAMWISVMAFDLFMQVVRKKKDMAPFERWYGFVVWGTSLFWATLPFFGDHVYGPADHSKETWCWIVPDHFAWRIVTWYFPLLVFFTFIAVMYSWIIYVLRSNQRSEFYQRDTEEDMRKKMEASIKLLRYPLVFIILWIVPIINRIQNWATNDDQIFWLVLLHNISTSVQGIVNTIIYFYDEQIYAQCTIAGIKSALLLLFSKETQEQHMVQRYELRFSSGSKNEQGQVPLDDDEERTISKGPSRINLFSGVSPVKKEDLHEVSLDD